MARLTHGSCQNLGARHKKKRSQRHCAWNLGEGSRFSFQVQYKKHSIVISTTLHNRYIKYNKSEIKNLQYSCFYYLQEIIQEIFEINVCHFESHTGSLHEPKSR